MYMYMYMYMCINIYIHTYIHTYVDIVFFNLQVANSLVNQGSKRNCPRE